MPATLQDDLKRKERALPSKTRQMIRVIVDEILRHCRKPRRKELSLIASKIVNKYPDSFLDHIGDSKIGSGFDSLLCQLETRVANVNRVKPHRVADQATDSDDSECSEPPKKMRAACSYGTKDWQPALPSSETSASQMSKKELMIEWHSKEEWDIPEITQLLNDTYPTIRSVINCGSSITVITAEWPFLVEEHGMLHHFQRLVGIPLKETLLTAFESKVPRLVSYLQMRQYSKPMLKTALRALEKTKREAGSNEADVMGIVFLLAAYFGEDTSVLVHTSNEDVRTQNV